jgi:hypothetical protein
LTIRKRKTAPSDKRGKKTLSEEEGKLILGIPLVRGIRPVVVQPQPIVVAFQVEDVRIAIAIGFVRRAIRTTAHLIIKEVGLYFMRDHESASAAHQVVSFLLATCISSARSHNRPRSQ